MANTMEVFMDAYGLDICSQGHGNYSQVFTTNRGTILKVTVDDAYMQFVDAIQGKDNPLFPKILTNFGEIGKVKDSGSHEYVPVYAVEMPRYLELIHTHSSKEYSDAYAAADVIKTFLKIHYGYEKKGPKQYSNLCLALLTLGVDWNDFWDAVDVCYPIVNQKRETGNEYEDTSFGFFDLHIDNWMIDPETDQLIMNDPIGGRNHVCGIDAYYEYGATYGEAMTHVDFEKARQIQKLIGDGFDKTLLSKFSLSVNYDRCVDPSTDTESKIRVKKSEKFNDIKLKQMAQFSGDEDMLVVLGIEKSQVYYSSERQIALRKVKERVGKHEWKDVDGYGIAPKLDGYGLSIPVHVEVHVEVLGGKKLNFKLEDFIF